MPLSYLYCFFIVEGVQGEVFVGSYAAEPSYVVDYLPPLSQILRLLFSFALPGERPIDRYFRATKNLREGG